MCCFMFFFFKQKTAYEMRISDWSSDVCSSDLDREFHRNGSFDLNAVGAPPAHSEGIGDGHKAARLPAALVQRAVRGVAKQPGDPAGRAKAPMCIEAIAGGDQARYVLEAASGTIEGQARGEGFARGDPEIAVPMLAVRPARAHRGDDRHPVRGRSEEHTSELQSLMRN